MLQGLAKTARDRGRPWIGSPDGEDLQINFKPPWSEHQLGGAGRGRRGACARARSRAPDLGVLVGSGDLSQRIRESLIAKKAASAETRVDYLGFANFMARARRRWEGARRPCHSPARAQAHLMDWGMKLILAGTLTPAQFLGYQFQILKVRAAAAPRALSRWLRREVAEEHGGTRTAYECDLRLRRKIAVRQGFALRGMSSQGLVAWCQAGAGHAVRRVGGVSSVYPRLGGPRLPRVNRFVCAPCARERQVLAESKNKVTDKAKGVGAAAASGKGPGPQSGKPAKGGGKDGMRRPRTPPRRSRSPAKPANNGKGGAKWAGQADAGQWRGSQWAGQWRGSRGARP